MAEGLNRVLLLGNLGADPEFKVTSTGQQVLKMRLATSETYLDRNKVRQERTEWHNVVIWGRRAEALSKFLTKGTRLFVEGGLRTTSYDDRDGNKRYRTEVIAENVILAGGRGDGPARGEGYGRGESSGHGYGRAEAGGRGEGGGGRGEGGGRPPARDDDFGAGPAQSSGGGYDDADYGPGPEDDDIPF